MVGAGALSEAPSRVVVDVAVDLALDAVELLGVVAVVSVVLSAGSFDERDEHEEGSGHDGRHYFGAHGSVVSG